VATTCRGIILAGGPGTPEVNAFRAPPQSDIIVNDRNRSGSSFDDCPMFA